MLGWLYTLFARRADNAPPDADDYEFVQHTDTHPKPLDITRAIAHKFVCYAGWYTRQTLRVVCDILEHVPAVPPLHGVMD